MKTGPLRQVSVEISPQAEEPVTELLSGMFGLPATVHTDLKRQRTTASVFLPFEAGWSAQQRRALAAGLEELRGEGIEIGGGRILARRLQTEDWANSWKRHFRPLLVGGRLLIKPTWSRRQPKPGQVLVVLDPGLSFGTGQHPTTLYCLGRLVARHSPRDAVLDLGTGSGILAIAAAKLGCRRVVAVDHDANAVRIARANARANGVRSIQFHQEDLTQNRSRVRGQFEMVCANLIADLLIAERQRILQYVRPGGWLVLAGILHTQIRAVTEAYRAGGARLLGLERAGEWSSCTLEVGR